jgi:hypothetical protein
MPPWRLTAELSGKGKLARRDHLLIAVMLKAPKGIWGYIADRFGWQLFPLARRLDIKT